MTKKIVWTRDDGGLTVTIPAYNDGARAKNPDGTYVQTDDELLQSVIDKRVPDGITAHVVDDSDPAVAAALSDRTFRNAWEWTTELAVNMPKARVIHMEKIRGVRNEKLKELDIEFMRAVEDNDTAAQATVKKTKQILRDIPADFSLSTYKTPETLAAAHPDELPPFD
jgi:hypothetical protein